MNSEPTWPRIDTSKPHPARRYDYWLGGKDNYPADRESADAVAEGFPTVRLAAVENRNFLRRAVNFLAADAGIRQFLDIGAGLPTAGNVHEIAQDIAPSSRIVYVDNDPIVLLHARDLLRSSPEGATAYIDADLRDPETILSHPAVTDVLDHSEPIALMLVAIMHFITDNEQAYRLVRTLCSALPSGSYLVLSHATSDHLAAEDLADSDAANLRSGVPFRLRTGAEITEFFRGYELVPPGIASVINWRPDGWRPHPRPEAVSMLAGAALIP